MVGVTVTVGVRVGVGVSVGVTVREGVTVGVIEMDGVTDGVGNGQAPVTTVTSVSTLLPLNH